MRKSIFLPNGVESLPIDYALQYRYALKMSEPSSLDSELYNDWLLSLAELARWIKKNTIPPEVFAAISKSYEK